MYAYTMALVLQKLLTGNLIVIRADPDKLDPDNRANILIRTTGENSIRAMLETVRS